MMLEVGKPNPDHSWDIPIKINTSNKDSPICFSIRVIYNTLSNSSLTSIAEDQKALSIATVNLEELELKSVEVSTHP